MKLKQIDYPILHYFDGGGVFPRIVTIDNIYRNLSKDIKSKLQLDLLRGKIIKSIYRLHKFNLLKLSGNPKLSGYVEDEITKKGQALVNELKKPLPTIKGTNKIDDTAVKPKKQMPGKLPAEFRRPTRGRVGQRGRIKI